MILFYFTISVNSTLKDIQYVEGFYTLHISFKLCQTRVAQCHRLKIVIFNVAWLVLQLNMRKRLVVGQIFIYDQQRRNSCPACVSRLR